MPRYHGAAGAREAAVYAVSSVERYLECPFKYFAAHVLRLPEERDDESGLTPQERGQFLHEVFETFFTRWQASGRGSDHDGERRATRSTLFERVAERSWRRCRNPTARSSARTCSDRPPRPALRSARSRSRSSRAARSIERLLEHELEGDVRVRTARRVRVACGSARKRIAST